VNVLLFANDERDPILNFWYKALSNARLNHYRSIINAYRKANSAIVHKSTSLAG